MLLPLLGAIAIGLQPESRSRLLALFTTGAALLLSLAVALPFDPRGGWQVLSQADWLPSLGIAFSFGLDGLGLHFALLTSVVAFASSAFAWRIRKGEKLDMAALLMVQAGVGLAFAGRDLFLFAAGWQLALTALATALAAQAPNGTSSKFRLFTGIASALSCSALLVLYMLNGSAADVVLLQQNHPAAVAPMEMQRVIFAVLAAGFALQMPLVPFHPWLLDALEDLPAPLAVMLSGVVAPLAAFGLIRLGLAVMPGPAQALSPLLVFLGLVSLLYGLWGALATVGRRRMACVLVAALGASAAGLGMMQLVTIKLALVLLAATSIGLPAWILAAEARPASGRLAPLAVGVGLAVVLWPLLTAGVLDGFASSLAPLIGL
ncbi:NADH-quinone oxidoreductase subunit M [compost metagenome]